MAPLADFPALEPVTWHVPGVGEVIWHRGKGAKSRVDASLPILVAMDWSPKSGGKNYAGLVSPAAFEKLVGWYIADCTAKNKVPCMYEVIQDFNASPTRLGVSAPEAPCASHLLQCSRPYSAFHGWGSFLLVSLPLGQLPPPFAYL